MHSHVRTVSQETHLICGYVFDQEGAVSPLGLGDVDEALKREGGFVWVHFNLASQRARHWLEAREDLEPFVRESLLDGNDTRPRMEQVGDGLLAVLSDMHYDFQYEPADIGTLRLFLDERRIVSCRRHPLKATDRLRKELEEGARFTSTVEVMAELIELLSRTLGDVVAKLSLDLDSTEDSILAARYNDGRGKLGQVRRLVVQLRRHVAPQKQAFGRIGNRQLPWADDDALARLRDATERMAGVLYDIEAVQERAKVLQDELSARLSEQLNRNLYVLSLVTVVFAPMTLISGIFGMNVAGLPGVGGHDTAFWWVMAAIVLSGLAMLLVIRPRR